MFDLGHTLLLAFDALLLIGVILWPLSRRFDDSDQGSGNLVQLTPPLRPSLRRCGMFTLVCLAACAVELAVQNPSAFSLYQSLVGRLAETGYHDPRAIHNLSRTLIPVVPVSVLAFGIATAAVLHATAGRRLMILAQAFLFVMVSALTDSLLAVFSLTTGLPLGPTPVIGILIHYGVAFLLMFRLAFTSFQLPKPTPLRVRRGFDWTADLKLCLALLAAVGIVGSAATFILEGNGSNPLFETLVFLAVPVYMFSLMFAILGVLRLVGPPLPPPPARRPLVEVIIPAFNEQLNIARLLRSLDAAAVRYEGPVRIILCDDGSVDDTGLLAREAMDSFVAATGTIVQGDHQGKSAALNRALQECHAEYCFRVDADCAVDEWSLLYSVAWFEQYPDVGLVGAFTLPKEPYTSWIDRMRMFELLFAFGFTRICMSEFDGIPCIPGTFTAFRRQPAVEVGGFVEGMYGEDVDFTCSIALTGYRAAVDRRIISYEDVPNTLRQLRVQRTRWNRGGTMSFARFTPFAVPFAGPRFWFTTVRAAGKRLSSPLHLASLLFAIALAVFHPTARHELARIGVALIAAQVPNVALKVVVAIYYKRARYLPWLICWWWFGLVKRLFALEAFLSFSTRPVEFPWAWRRPRVSRPVIVLTGEELV